MIKLDFTKLDQLITEAFQCWGEDEPSPTRTPPGCSIPRGVGACPVADRFRSRGLRVAA